MRILFQTVLILLVVSTLSICTIKPDMHKSVIVYNSDYTLVPEEVAVTEKEEIPIMEIPAKPVETVTKQETKTVKTKTQTKPQQVKKVETKQTVNKTETKVKQVETPKTQTVVQTQKVEKPITKTETKQQTVERPVVKTETKMQTIPRVMTQQEEEIAWNVWRSNLQNKIMQDVKLPLMPNGITFKFSFTVDKYGKISNVQTWSTTTSYTPYAIQYIAPVIRSYQGKEILNFPQGSTRTSTEVKGGWKLSPTERYSTPQDYNDYEKVVR